MTLTELLNNIRNQYIDRFDEFLIKYKDFKLIKEGQLINKNGELVCEGFLNTPIRKDLVIIKDNEIESITVDSESIINFNSFTIEYSEKLKITFNPFQWDYVNISFANSPYLQWELLSNWFNSSFLSEKSDQKYYEVPHFISDPLFDDDKVTIIIDLGTSTTNTFDDLLTVLEEMNLKEINIFT